MSLAGSALLFASQPPLDLTWLAWLAPALWISWFASEQLPGRRPYLALWAAGSCYWLASLYWLCLPHPVTSIGWLALSLYMGMYLPLMVGLGRLAVRKFRFPLVLAAPVVWTLAEMVQARLFTGFNMASLAHTQHRLLGLIQISDLAGSYAVTFLVVFVAASILAAVEAGNAWRRLGRLVPAAVLVGATLIYGQWRTSDVALSSGPTIALVQGSIDTTIKTDPREQEQVFRRYFELTQQALADHPRPDLIVWPETMFRQPLISHTADARPGDSQKWTIADLDAHALQTRATLQRLSSAFDAPLLLGIDALHYGAGTLERYNSAIYVTPESVGPRYDKTHPVVFGEYIPLAKTFPSLYKLTPVQAGIEWGSATPVFRAGNARIAATICYETTLSQVIRRQVSTERSRGEEPDVLVNLTNDGWFRGSSELDMHLACGVFRAIECRKPLLVAANTGFSAWIDSSGRIVSQAKRRADDWIVAKPELDRRQSFYLAWGDWVPLGWLMGCMVVGAIGRRAAKPLPDQGFR